MSFWYLYGRREGGEGKRGEERGGQERGGEGRRGEARGGEERGGEERGEERRGGEEGERRRGEGKGGEERRGKERGREGGEHGHSLLITQVLKQFPTEAVYPSHEVSSLMPLTPRPRKNHTLPWKEEMEGTSTAPFTAAPHTNIEHIVTLPKRVLQIETAIEQLRAINSKHTNQLSQLVKTVKGLINQSL